MGKQDPDMQTKKKQKKDARVFRKLMDGTINSDDIPVWINARS